MSVSADALREHLAYTTWASRRLMDVASQLSPEELNHDFQTADRTILGTLVHVFAADRIWLARVNHAANQPFLTDADRSLAVLQTEWPAVLDRWREFASKLTDATARENLDYKDTRGNPYRQPLWQIILHVVNHGTHHRGQVSGFLRTLGHTPPPLDLTAYYREQTAHA